MTPTMKTPPLSQSDQANTIVQPGFTHGAIPRSSTQNMIPRVILPISTATGNQTQSGPPQEDLTSGEEEGADLESPPPEADEPSTFIPPGLTPSELDELTEQADRFHDDEMEEPNIPAEEMRKRRIAARIEHLHKRTSEETREKKSMDEVSFGGGSTTSTTSEDMDDPDTRPTGTQFIPQKRLSSANPCSPRRNSNTGLDQSRVQKNGQHE